MLLDFCFFFPRKDNELYSGGKPQTLYSGILHMYAYFVFPPPLFLPHSKALLCQTALN